MENQNFESQQDQLDHQTVGNYNPGINAANGQPGGTETEDQDEFSELDEETDGSDADQDELTGEDAGGDLDEQLEGSDADYDEPSELSEDDEEESDLGQNA